MRSIYGYILPVLFVFSGSNVFAQQQMLPLGDFFTETVSEALNKSAAPVNTGFKPLLKSEVQTVFNVDSLLYDTVKAAEFLKKHNNRKIWNKLFFDDFISVKDNDFTLLINPLFYLQYGKTDIDDDNFFINTRGIEIKGNLGKKLSYYSDFRENQARFRPYIYDWSEKRLVVPGQGAFKRTSDDLSIFDFSGASAYLSYTPFNRINIQIGQDKNFIGEGHRSLLLSDNAANYPFVKFSFVFKSFKYVTLFTQFQDFEGEYYYYHFKKHGAFNYLSYNFKNRFELGLFEGVIYRTTDTSEYINKIPADYFIPVAGVRTVVNGFNSDNNLLVGLNIKLKVNDYIQLYGQAALDDSGQNKTAYQGGIKIFDVLRYRIKNLKFYFQAEYNTASEYTYSVSDYKFQTWTHYNQELAVPFGGSFSEIFVKSEFSYKKFLLDIRYNDISTNKNGVYSDVYFLENYVYTATPPEIDITHKTITLSYVINRRTGLCLYAGADIRTETSDVSDITEKFLMFGLRTSLSNFYYDF